jgi:hypothetical protein
MLVTIYESMTMAKPWTTGVSYGFLLIDINCPLNQPGNPLVPPGWKAGWAGPCWAACTLQGGRSRDQAKPPEEWLEERLFGRCGMNWWTYFLVTFWLFNIAMENHHFLKVNRHKSSMNGPFSIAILNILQLPEGNSMSSLISLGEFPPWTATIITFWGSASSSRAGVKLPPWSQPAAQKVNVTGLQKQLSPQHPMSKWECYGYIVGY